MSNRQQKIRAKAARRREKATRPIEHAQAGFEIVASAQDYGTVLAVAAQDGKGWRGGYLAYMGKKWRRAEQQRQAMINLLTKD